MSSVGSLPERVAPPRLHWGWVFILSLITFNLFGMIWLIVQANWSRRVRGRSKAFGWALAYPAVFLLYLVLAVMFSPDTVSVMRLLLAAVWLVAIYTLRSEFEGEPIGLTLGGVMTFFFSILYFQYFLRDYPVSALGSEGESSAFTYPAL